MGESPDFVDRFRKKKKTEIEPKCKRVS